MNLDFIHKKTSLMSKKKSELVEHIMRLEHNNSALKNNVWTLCSEKMPENEKEVEITYTRKHYRTGEIMYLTARAFYEDGTLTTEDSTFCWEEGSDWEYIEEKDGYMIPEGWWESVSFSERLGEIDMPVVAWRYPAEPYRP